MPAQDDKGGADGMLPDGRQVRVGMPLEVGAGPMREVATVFVGAPGAEPSDCAQVAIAFDAETGLLMLEMPCGCKSVVPLLSLAIDLLQTSEKSHAEDAAEAAKAEAAAVAAVNAARPPLIH